MNVNGKNISFDDMQTIDFFKGIDVGSLPEDNLETMADAAIDVSYTLNESNIASNLPKRFHNARFGDFDSEFNNELKEFALNPEDNVLLLSSNAGCGKTSFLADMIHERAINGLSAGYYFSNIMLAPMLRTCRSFTAKESEYDFIQRLANVDFLVLDEYGTDKNLEEESTFVSTVLRLRYDNGLPTAIATNLTPARFKITLCGIDPSGKTVDELKAILAKLEKDNPTLNRVVSVLKTIYIKGTSHRGVTC